MYTSTSFQARKSFERIYTLRSCAPQRSHVAYLTVDPGGPKFESQLGHIHFIETDNEIISTVNYSFR